MGALGRRYCRAAAGCTGRGWFGHPGGSGGDVGVAAECCWWVGGGGPALLECVGDAVLHGGGDVAVDAAYAGEAVAEAAGLGDFGDVVFDEPGLVGVA